MIHEYDLTDTQQPNGNHSECRLSITLQEGDRVVQVDQDSVHSDASIQQTFKWHRWFSWVTRQTSSTSLLFQRQRRPSLAPLLTHSHQDTDSSSVLSALPPPGKARCWCCWDSIETLSNPLVRVCMGCKDPDLQWIHQECVNKYVSGLPGAMNTQEDEEHGLQRRGSTASNASDYNESDGLLPFGGQKLPEFYCTRCKDPYHVISTRIHPLFVMVKDPFLMAAMSLMTVCMVVLTSCCIILIAQNWGTDHVLFDFPWLRLGMTTFAFCMLVFCHSVNIITWSMVLSHCSGHTLKQVTPVMVDPVIELEHEQV